MQNLEHSRLIKFKYSLMFIIVLVLVIGLAAITNDFADKRQEIVDSELLLMKTRIQTILGMHEKTANIIFETIINKDILRIFNELTPENKAQQRAKLLQKMNPLYKKIVRNNVRQLHFHLPNNESFLRLHRPDKFGDDLTGIRESVAMTNKELRPVKGFEEGRVYNGYRFVFPMMLEDKHLGSVETSFSIQSILRELSRIDSTAYFDFLMRKEVVDKKLFKDEKSNYVRYPFSEFFYQDQEIAKNFLLPKSLHQLLSDNKTEINQKFSEYEQFGHSIVPSFGLIHSDVLNVYFPIYNVSNNYVALIVSHKSYPLLSALRKSYLKICVIIVFLSLIIIATINYLFKYVDKDIAAQRLNVLRATTVSLHHEIRNPLAIISSTCAYIDKKHGVEIGDPKLFQSVMDSIARITTILDKLKGIEEVELTEYTKDSEMINIEPKRTSKEDIQ